MKYLAHRSFQKRLIRFLFVICVHKSEGSNDVLQFSTAAAIQVASTCSKQQSYHWTLIRNPTTVEEVVGKTCG